MRTITDLPGALAAHLEWVTSGGRRGTRADLGCADLGCADLGCADLRGADLVGASGVVSAGPIGSEGRIAVAVAPPGGGVVQVARVHGR